MQNTNSTSSSPLIDLRGVWKIFGANEQAVCQDIKNRGLSRQETLEQHKAVMAVADVTLQIYPGETFCVMGLSGSGKSTLVRLINRLIPPTAGELMVSGQNVSTMGEKEVRAFRSARLGMVFQNAALLPHRTVLENTAFPLELRNMPRKDREEKARAALELVHLAGWESYFPDQLSGGMQQRVGLARALASDPEILLMDEPFSALDPIIRRDLQDEFVNIVKSVNKTAVFITHDLDEAIRVGDRIAVMKDGRVQQVGTPVDIVMTPANEHIAKFVSGVSRLPILTAADVMDEAATDAPQNDRVVPARAPLSNVIDRAIAEGFPMGIERDGKIIGQITEKSLLKSISTHEFEAVAKSA
ncbi:betaine/proline/choline family ABC transporter ATP-binding protein [Ruegeria sp.]|uniref:quaternary amine ABC transporter ATP-binding protein n=1 Tax=Ruegeria sp. TaxID=1879320 RepID=UPI00230D1260|nr:betaine/proline/choline family ABC transporter ATP-binding protein [Ruegeria sp.]MDA7965557.1 betaine/proline/choline family ABC transporter ATP-binding protein [Ruegeria sp.]